MKTTGKRFLATWVDVKSPNLLVYIIDIKHLTTCLLFLTCLRIMAQPIVDSSAIKTESMRLGINTFSLGTAGDWRTNPTSNQKLQTGLGQYLVYNRALPSNRFITNNLWVAGKHQLFITKNWTWQNEAWQTSYFANSTRLAQYMSRVRFTPFETPATGFFLQIGAGILNDKRLNNNNSGPTADFIGEYYTTGSDTTLILKIVAQGMIASISPRQNERLSGVLQVSKSFPAGGFLGGEVGYLKRKVEDFLSSDIQSIVSDTVYARAKFRYELMKNLLFSSENEYLTPNRSFFYKNAETKKESRNVVYKQDEYQSLNTLSYQSKKLKTTFSFESKQRKRSYDIIKRFGDSDPNFAQQQLAYNQKLKEEQIKDILEQYTTYTTDLRWRPHQKHIFKINYVAQLLRVDTKSDLNNQDRDEILYAGELSYEWKLWSGFSLINKVSASLRHLVFIEASQSSENFKDRILRWEPGFRMNRKRLTWNGQLGIWATYQVRDFESQSERDRSNRVLLFAHQIEYRLDSRWKILGDFLRRENRLSQLNWERFSESPIDTVTIYDISIKPQYQIFNVETEWAFQVGYRAYWQVRKSKASLTDPAVGARLIHLRNYIIQQGPQVKLIWNKSKRLRLQTEFWLQWSSQYFKYERTEDVYLGTSYSPEALAFKDSRFLPYFTIQATWFFKK